MTFHELLNPESTADFPCKAPTSLQLRLKPLFANANVATKPSVTVATAAIIFLNLNGVEGGGIWRKSFGRGLPHTRKHESPTMKCESSVCPVSSKSRSNQRNWNAIFRCVAATSNKQRVQEMQAWSDQDDFLANRQPLYLSYSGSIISSPSWKKVHSNTLSSELVRNSLTKPKPKTRPLQG